MNVRHDFIVDYNFALIENKCVYTFLRVPLNRLYRNFVNSHVNTKLRKINKI